jgi:hypothetical protein
LLPPAAPLPAPPPPAGCLPAAGLMLAPPPPMPIPLLPPPLLAPLAPVAAAPPAEREEAGAPCFVVCAFPAPCGAKCSCAMGRKGREGGRRSDTESSWRPRFIALAVVINLITCARVAAAEPAVSIQVFATRDGVALKFTQLCTVHCATVALRVTASLPVPNIIIANGTGSGTVPRDGACQCSGG